MRSLRIITYIVLLFTIIGLAVLIGYQVFSPDTALKAALNEQRDRLFFLLFVIVVFIGFSMFITERTIEGEYKNQISIFQAKERMEFEQLVGKLPIALLTIREQNGEYYIENANDLAFEIFGYHIADLPLVELSGMLDYGRLQTQVADVIEVNGYHLRVFPDFSKKMIKMLDVTELEHARFELAGKKVVAGYIDVDNFDAVVSKSDIDEVELSFRLNKQLTQWFEERSIFIRQYTTERWLVVTDLNRLSILERDNFSVLDVVKELGKRNNIQLSISASFADADDFWTASKLAWPLLELTENRGGDQVVVRDENGDVRTYGGTTKIDAQRTQSKARAMAQLLGDVLSGVDNVYIMGHQYADADVVGSVLGMRHLCEAKGIKATIVLDWNNTNSEVREVYRELDGVESLFTHPNDINIDDLNIDTNKLVVLDTSIQEMTEKPELVDILDVILIDHHRKNLKSINHASVSYIEPYASSTAELVTELLQYIPEKITMPLSDATMLFYGMVLDSQNFRVKTGRATFSAASYLRDKGADPILLHELTRESFEAYQSRTKLLSRARVVDGGKVIVVAENNGKYYRRDELAKAADAVLEFSGVTIAVVVGMTAPDKINISARSLGDYNVQQLMENFGGGGHFTMAAAQIEGSDIEYIGMRVENELRKL